MSLNVYTDLSEESDRPLTHGMAIPNVSSNYFCKWLLNTLITKYKRWLGYKEKQNII